MMHLPFLGEKAATTSPARLLTRTLVALAGAFTLVMTAGVIMVLAVTHDANVIEAQRQKSRIVAALQNQKQLRQMRLEALASDGVFQAALKTSASPSILQWAFSKIGKRFAEADGAFLVTASGQVLAGLEDSRIAGQSAYDALGAEGPPAKPIAGKTADESADHDLPGIGDTLRNTSKGPLAVIAIDLQNILKLPATDPLSAIRLVGYRRLTPEALAMLATFYRVHGLEITQREPADPLVKIALPSHGDAPMAWMTWTPERPGDAMLAQFKWALLAAVLIFAGIVFFEISNLRTAIMEIAKREAEIDRLAGQDALSMLPNRRIFDERLAQELSHLGRRKTGLALLMLDLDRFKAVNDTYGHVAGDELIRQVSQRLLGMMRLGDTVARLGGDEFGIIQTEMNDVAASIALAERILEALQQPFTLSGVALTIGCSIGIALAPQDGETADILLKYADVALYQSKNEGRNRISFFEPRMNSALHLKRVVEEELRQAIAQDELVLHYQPQVSIDGTEIVGVEALVRWPHPVHGMVPPSEFIGIAEERGLIVPLSDWVLRRACRDARNWDGIKLAVNVSPIQFRQKDFVSNIIKILAETGFDPARLELELTEGVLVEDADAAENAIIELRAHGICMALDDFGTGYSSLIYLRRFAFDKIKIDRSFLEYMETTGESAILVHSVVHLGRALGLRVCAEGVETAEQHRFLKAVGCHELQGFLFSKAVPPETLELLLTQHEPFAAQLAAA